MLHRLRSLSFLTLILLWAAAFPLQAESPVKTLNIDPQQSRILIRVGSGGVFGSFGHPHILEATEYSGRVLYDPEHVERSSMTLKIRSASLVVVDKESQKDKAKIEQDMREKVLETSSHPEIAFTSTQVSVRNGEGENREITLKGNLSIHGVTQGVSLDMKIAFRDSRLTAKGEIELKQTDYGIKPFSVAGGTVKVKNEVRLTFDVTAL